VGEKEKGRRGQLQKEGREEYHEKDRCKMFKENRFSMNRETSAVQQGFFCGWGRSHYQD